MPVHEMFLELWTEHYIAHDSEQPLGRKDCGGWKLEIKKGGLLASYTKIEINEETWTNL